MRASGQVADYTASVCDEIRQLFAVRLTTSVDNVAVTITAGSVLIDVEISADDASAASAMAAAIAPVTSSAEDATTFLAAVSGVNIVVADVVQAARTEVRAARAEIVAASTPIVPIIGGVVAAALVLPVLIALILCCVRKRSRPRVSVVPLPVQQQQQQQVQVVPAQVVATPRGEPPEDYICPISLMLMEDPVMVVQSGITYEREEIEAALRINPNRDPKTNQEWSSPLTLAPNVLVRKMILEWQERKAQAPPPMEEPPQQDAGPSGAGAVPPMGMPTVSGAAYGVPQGMATTSHSTGWDESMQNAAVAYASVPDPVKGELKVDDFTEC